MRYGRFYEAMLAVALGAVAVSPTVAQSGTQHERSVDVEAAFPRYDVRASALLGLEVRDSDGQTLGQVEDLFVDTDARKVRYIVVGTGGTPELQNKLYPRPVSAFRFTPGGDAVTLEVSREELAQAPGFEDDMWPAYKQPGFAEELRQFFGEEPDQGPATGLVRGSALLGRDVNDRRGEEVGEMLDFVVDVGTGSGNIPYVLFAGDQSLSLERKLLPLPLSVLDVPPERDEELVLHMDPEVLRVAESMERENWANLNSPAFQEDVESSMAEYEGDGALQSGDSGDRQDEEGR